ELPEAVALAPLGPLRVGTRQALLAPDSGDPGGERLQRPLERLHLADVAAAVRIAFPEVRPFLPVLLGDREHLGPDQLEPVALDQPLTRLVRLAEEELRVELDHRYVEAELGDHVHEHGRLLLP